jgi:hypothetical protein
MSITRNRSFAVAITFLAVVACLWLRLPLEAQGPAQSAVMTMQIERRDVLKTRVEVYEKLVAIARSSPEELAAARNDLFDAELDLATTADQRAAVLQQKLENAKLLEELAQARKHSGRGNEADVLLAKSNRLTIEIQIGRNGK